MRLSHLLPIASLVVLAACGGGGGGATPSSLPTVKPTTAPASTRHISLAPLSSTPITTDLFHRGAQALGANSSLPFLVESAGSLGIWPGAIAVWVTDSATGLDVQETSGTVTATNGLGVGNPSFQALTCPGDPALWCAAHPLGWWFGTSSDPTTKPVGKQTLTFTFGDGTTGSVFDYVYNGLTIPCNGGIVYQAGLPVATTTSAASDVYADCLNTNLVFPKGAILASAPVTDSFGLTTTIMPTLTTAFTMTNTVTTVPFASVTPGSVYGVTTQDGGVAKVYLEGAGVALSSAVNGMSLHANADGTYPF